MMINIDFNKTKRVTYWFFLFCVLHLVVWTLIPSLCYQNPPHDAIEGLAWGRLWLWGYVKHPPLAAWLTALASSLSDGLHDWPIYLLSQIAIITAFWATWRLAKKILQPWHALIAVVLLEGVIYYTVESVNFNPNVLMLPLWALAILMFYNAVTTQKIYQWIGLGATLALAMLAKYESILLCFSMLLILITTQTGRDSFKKIGFYLALIVSILIFLPNLIYLIQHDFDAIRYATGELDKTNADWPLILQLFFHPVYFFIEQLGAIAGVFVLSIPFYRQAKKHFDLKSFDKQFLLIISFFPIVFTLLLSFIFNTSLVPRWGFPFFSLIGILWMAWLQPLLNYVRLRAFAVLVAVFMLVLVVGESVLFVYGPHMVGKAKHAEFFPGKTIALSITQQWHQLYHRPLSYVAGDYYTVVNISAYSPDRPVPYLDMDKIKSPWVDEKTLRAKGAVFVVIFDRAIKGQNMLNEIHQRYPQVKFISIQNFAYATTAKVPPLKLWVGFLPPSQN